MADRGGTRCRDFHEFTRIDPAGQNGGPVLQTLVLNRASLFGKLTYTTMPEQLQARGISWKVYTSPDQNILNSIFSDNVLSYFKKFQDQNSSLYKNAFLPQFPTDFLSDALTGNLPQVSWVIATIVDSDHPPRPHFSARSPLLNNHRFEYESSAMGEDGAVCHV